MGGLWSGWGSWSRWVSTIGGKRAWRLLRETGPGRNVIEPGRNPAAMKYECPESEVRSTSLSRRSRIGSASAFGGSGRITAAVRQLLRFVEFGPDRVLAGLLERIELETSVTHAASNAGGGPASSARISLSGWSPAAESPRALAVERVSLNPGILCGVRPAELDIHPEGRTPRE